MPAASARRRVTNDELEIELHRVRVLLDRAEAEIASCREEIARLRKAVAEAQSALKWIEQQRSRQMDLELGSKP